MLKKPLVAIVSAAFIVVGPGPLALSVAAQTIMRGSVTGVTVTPAIGTGIKTPTLAAASFSIPSLIPGALIVPSLAAPVPLVAVPAAVQPMALAATPILPVAAAKPALTGLESSGARFAQAARDGASETADREISEQLFDASSVKNGPAETPAVAARKREPTGLPELEFSDRIPESKHSILRDVLSKKRNAARILPLVEAALQEYNRNYGQTSTLADLNLYVHYFHEGAADYVYQVTIERRNQRIGVIVARINKSTHKLTLVPNDD
jgi:hypothetical protein